MNARHGWIGVLAGVVLPLSACAGEGSTGSQAPATATDKPNSWTGLAVDCPPLTAPGFASTKPFASPATGLEEPGQLRMACSYRHRPDELPPVTTRLQIALHPANGQVGSEVVTSDRARKASQGQAVIDLPGLEEPATASADGSGPAEAVTSSKNAHFFAVVIFDEPVTSQAEIKQHADVLATILRDLAANLRAA